MPPRTCGSNPQVMDPIDSPERLARRAVLATPTRTDEICPKRCKKHSLELREIMTRLIKETSDWMNADRDSLFVERVASDAVVERTVNRTEVRKMTKKFVKQLTDKLDVRVAQLK